MKRILFSLILSFVSISFSQTVTLDNTFGTNGKVVEPISSVYSGPVIMETLSNGEIIFIGANEFNLNGNIFLSKLNSDGSLDTTFGTNGIVNTQLVTEMFFISNLKIQPDGKILVTSSKSNSFNSDFFDFATQRFNADGTIDTSFGNNGIVVTDFAGKGDFANALDLQSDGKIIVAGSSYINNNASTCLSLVRYLNNGTLDLSFGVNGKLLLNDFNASLNTIKILSNDSILLGGYTSELETVEDYGNFGIYKVTSNGSVDTSFGNNGKIIYDFGADDYLYSFAEYNGNIFIAGTSRIPGSAKMVLMKYSMNGSIDTSFGVNGIVYRNKNTSTLYDGLADLIIKNDGKITCSGYTIENDTADFLIIQFNSDGSIDNNFNSIGYVTTDFDGGNDSSYTMSLNDNKIVCSGFTNINSEYKSAFARYNIENLSIDEFQRNIYSVSPNPFSDKIMIDFKNNSLQEARIELLDNNSRMIYGQKHFFINNNLEINLPNNLSKGIYILKVNTENETQAFKLIK